MKAETRSARLVTATELQALLPDPRLKLIDTSWHMPDQGRSGHAEFLERRLPGAVFFDIDVIADADSGLPHTLASPEEFSRHVGRLGVSDEDTIVVYDSLGMFSAPRVAWNLRDMGAQSVRVLDGGLPAWLRANGPIETGPPAVPVTSQFQVRPVDNSTADRDAVLAHLTEKSAVVVDVRAAGRFSGAQAEPRAGMRSGHMPGAINLPFQDLLVDGEMAPNEQLRDVFAEAGIAPKDLVVASCGSGVTACIALLALECIGHGCHALYDGSWSEWGSRDDTPVVVEKNQS